MTITVDLYQVLLAISWYYSLGCAIVVTYNMLMVILWPETRAKARRLMVSKISDPFFWLGMWAWPWFILKESRSMAGAILKGPRYFY